VKGGGRDGEAGRTGEEGKRIGDPMSETVYYQDDRVYITDARVVIDGETFSMEDVTSAKLVTKSPKVLWPIVMLGVGIAGIIAGAIVVANDGGAACLVAAAVPVFLGCMGLRRAEFRHYVVTRSTSDGIPELQFDDPAYGHRIVHAMNEAIVARE
jgi:hypothetical protein